MAQNLFAGTVPPATNSLSLLDANFTELYGFSKNLVSDSGGSVAIGYATPASFDSAWNRLVVGNGSADQGLTIFAGTSSAATIAFADGTVGAAQYAGLIQYSHTSNFMALWVNASEALRVDASRNLLLGRTSQSSGGKFEVAGNVVLQPSAGAPTLGTNGDMSFQLVSDTSLKILVRGSDGTTRSVTLTLA